MISLSNTLVKTYLREHYKQIKHFMEHSKKVQEDLRSSLIESARYTEWGISHGFGNIKNAADFAAAMPINDYDSLKPFINRMMMGESDILWKGRIHWYSKSSGTTNDKSKYIPVSEENLYGCHHKGTRDTLAFWYNENPDSQLFAGKVLVMGGSHTTLEGYPDDTYIGDVSAIMMHHIPFYARHFHTPELSVAMMNEWESKIELIAEQVLKEKVTNISGVPTWTLVLFKRLLELTGKKNILEVLPHFELYMHGGVSFEPYRQQFRELLPDDKVQYREVYNASEGFFAVQDSKNAEGMMLLLNNGIYYEFIPLSELDKENPKSFTLGEVELGVNYAIIISTTGGLWRYMVGDTVRFTTLKPYRVVVSGRTKAFINAFGEEVMVENTDKALAATCLEFNAKVSEYTVAPIYLTAQGKGGHEWLIEFETQPDDIAGFAEKLDLNLQKLNSDYEAKRYKNIALQPLVLRVLPKNSFYNWMKKKGKVGGQNKIPRLANHRTYVEDILSAEL